MSNLVNAAKAVQGKAAGQPSPMLDQHDDTTRRLSSLGCSKAHGVTLWLSKVLRSPVRPFQAAQMQGAATVLTAHV